VGFIEQTEGGRLVGIRATYLAAGKKRKGIAQVLAEAGPTEEKNFQLAEGDYVKSIDCLRDESGVIVGLAMISQQNAVLRGGLTTDHRQSLAIPAEKHPACLFGCLLDHGLEMFGAELCPDQ
jgi:Cys-tRNA synthase (O-phospho-L-seryl-tRNA:Cys-tRNA synthase)